MRKIHFFIYFLICSGCSSGRFSSIELGEGVTTELAEEISNSWHTKYRAKIASITQIDGQECERAVREYSDYDVCTGAYLVSSKHIRNKGFSAYEAFRICNKSRCQVILGNTNHGIEE